MRHRRARAVFTACMTYVRLAFTQVVAYVMVALFVGRLRLSGRNSDKAGHHAFYAYLTNWGWQAQVAAWLVLACAEPHPRARAWTHVWVTPVLSAFVFQIWALFFSAVAADGGVTQALSEQGYSTSQILSGDKVAHTVPLIFVAAYLSVHAGALRQAYAPWYPRLSPPAKAGMWVYWLAAPLVLSVVYMSAMDARAVYNLDVRRTLGTILPVGLLAPIAATVFIQGVVARILDVNPTPPRK